MSQLRCVLADPVSARCAHLTRLLEARSSIKVVDVVDTTDRLVASCRRPEADVFVIDWELISGRSIPEAAAVVHSVGPNRCLLLLPFSVIRNEPGLGNLGTPYMGRPDSIDGLESIVLQITTNLVALRVLQNVDAQRRQAQKMEALGRLAAGVAHDFNNQLSIISSFTNSMLEGAGPAHPMRESLEQVKRAAERASALTRQLLAFGRKQLLRPRLVDLNGEVSRSCDLLKRLLPREITFDVKLASDIGVVEADPTQIEQVITNLVVNARDSMPEGGRLTLETRRIDPQASSSSFPPELAGMPLIELSVSDTGHGMGPETMAHIFEPFFTTKGPRDGIGLGLSTVYGIVQQSNGVVTVESEPGKGTTFRVFLPRAASAPAEAEAQPAVPSPVGGHETILLVEDERVVRIMAASVLRRNGYDVLDAGDGETALELAANHTGPIHLLIADLVMPGINGSSLADRILQQRPDVKVLFVSGYTQGMAAYRANHDGITAILEKPFTPQSLLQWTRTILDGRDVS